MVNLLPLVLAFALSAAPPLPVDDARIDGARIDGARLDAAWIDDAATQILARAMLEEARARTRSADARPTRADLDRALARCLDNVDNLMLLSGLMPMAREPEPLKRARTRPRVFISSRDLSASSDEP